MSSDVIYFQRHSRSALHRVFIFASLCLLCAISSVRAGNVECCPEGTYWVRSSNCSDGSSVRIDCQVGLYKLDPARFDYDNFTIEETEEDTWLVHEGHRVPSDRYCLLRTQLGEDRIALRCFEEEDNYQPPEWRNVLFCILSIVSAVFLIMTLAVYVILPELREIQDKAMMATVTSLAISYIVLSVQHVREHEQGEEAICLSLAFLLYYAFMSAFFWLNVVSFNIWRSVWFKNCRAKDKPLFMAYCAVGWGVPLCFLLVALATHHTDGNHLKPRFGERSCWFGGISEMWAYFYGPIAILLTLNVIYLGLTSWRLWHEYRDYSGGKLRALRFKCLLYFKLILVMGLTWIFEVVSFAAGARNNEYWIPTDILNALQGLVIFLLLVATRKRVRKLLAKKRPCGIAFPKSWVAYEDEECEAVLPEELELSQQG